MASLSPYAFDHGSSPSSSVRYYPPLHNGSNPSFIASSTSLTAMKEEGPGPTLFPDRSHMPRTPSPTPSESALLARKGIFDFEKMKNWRFWIRREWLWYYIIFGIIIILVILISVYDREIVRWLQPTAQKIKDLPFGWLIPIGIFFVISFPPLFGHEILAIVCGVVWGTWLGFAIVAGGTFIGEIGNFYAFRYCCRARGEKLEKTDLQYGCLAETVRRGGFRVALIARYSAIPGHFTTAVFSTCGMAIYIFAAAAFFSLPKQFVTVYIGVVLEASGTGTESSKDKIISDAVLALTIIITCLAMWYIYREMDKVKYEVVYRRRKNRMDKLARAQSQSVSSSTVFNPSDADLPLGAETDTLYQRWDSRGHASGYAGNPNLGGPNARIHAPSPQKAEVNRIPTYRTENGGGYSTTGERYDPQTREGAAPPVMPAASRRNESMDTVSWDTSNQGANSYQLPTMAPHSPFTGGIHAAPASPTSTPNPFRRNTEMSNEVLSNPSLKPAPVLISQSVAATQEMDTPLPAPLPPPPPSPTRMKFNPPSYSHQPFYTSSSPQTSGSQANLYSQNPYSPSLQQQFPTSVFTSSVPMSPVQSVQTPTQHEFAPSYPSFPPQGASQPTMAAFQEMQNSQAQGSQPPYAMNHAAMPPSPLHSPYPPHTPVPPGTYFQEGNDETGYYSHAHSGVPTGHYNDERLPSPTGPPPGYRF